MELVRLGGRHGGGGTSSRSRTWGNVCAVHPGFELAVRTCPRCPWWPPRSAPGRGRGRACGWWRRTSVMVRGRAQLLVAGPPVVAARWGSLRGQGRSLVGARARRARRGDTEGCGRGDRAGQLQALLRTAVESVGGRRRSWLRETRRIAATRRCSREIVPRERRRPYRRARSSRRCSTPGPCRARRTLRPLADHRARAPRRQARWRALLGSNPLTGAASRPTRPRSSRASSTCATSSACPSSTSWTAGLRDRNRAERRGTIGAERAPATPLPGHKSVGIRLVRKASEVAGDCTASRAPQRRTRGRSGDWVRCQSRAASRARYRRELEAAEDPAARRAEIEERLNGRALTLPHAGASDRGQHRPERHGARFSASGRCGRTRSVGTRGTAGPKSRGLAALEPLDSFHHPHASAVAPRYRAPRR